MSVRITPEVQPKKFNVVALGARDYYQVALALHSSNMLGRLITDFYAPDALRGLLKKRFDPELPSRTVRSLLPFAAVVPLFVALGLFERKRRLRLAIDYAFGFAAAALTRLGCNRAVVYSYYLQGFVGFYRLISARPAELICFQVHPAPDYIRRLMREDARAFNTVDKIDFAPEPEESLDASDASRYTEALAYCDHIICASNVTLRSLSQNANEWKNRVSIVPYGSKFENMPTKPAQAMGNRIKLISACQLTQRKGLHWAFKAMSSLNEDQQSKFEWTIVSAKRDAAIEAAAPNCVRFESSIPHNELAQWMATSDLFVMPSVIEGFGLVYIEALSFGTPVMFTEETGAADFCVSGEHGFQVPCRDWQKIRNVFEAIAADPSQVRHMRIRCSEAASHLTWANFRKNIQTICGEQRPGHETLPTALVRQ